MAVTVIGGESVLHRIFYKDESNAVVDSLLVSHFKKHETAGEADSRNFKSQFKNELSPRFSVSLHHGQKKLTVWCALWACGIIGRASSKNDEGHNVTVNGDRYRAMITNFFIPELNNHDVQELWFQQDGATCPPSSCHNRFIERHVW
ncbi:hypothetical protein TNCV_1264571 [Trichonephila clavipes]|nr:hypothetical protein TNCV_1264571 [Trichonephila clavipes]